MGATKKNMIMRLTKSGRSTEQLRGDQIEIDRKEKTLKKVTTESMLTNRLTREITDCVGHIRGVGETEHEGDWASWQTSFGTELRKGETTD